ncbi:hypothetical protein [Pseudoxanthomonas wuyuanensis]
MKSGLHWWKQKGVISLWRYAEFQKSYGGWHLSADDAGAHSLLQLLKELQSAPESHRTVAITPPSKQLIKVPNYQQGRAVWMAPEKLQVQVSSAPDTWEFPDDLDPARLTFGTSYLPELTRALEGIPHGEGDFSIGSKRRDKSRLWFWWWLDAA